MHKSECLLKRNWEKITLTFTFLNDVGSSVSKLTATCNILKRFQARKISTECKNYPEGD